jgi:sugar phosphate permease
MLQGVVALGIAIGAVVAARMVSLRESVRVLPIGVTMGLIVMMMIFVQSLPLASVLMVAVGACAGFFVVPMNALLQHRGHVLMGAGHSIAVQNFSENIGILVMVGLYALMVRWGLAVNHAIVLFGFFVSGAMALVMLRHRLNQAQSDSLHLIGMDKPAGHGH